MNDALQQRWQILVNPYCDNNHLLTGFFNELVTHYNEKHRYFHTLKHIECLFRDIDAASKSCEAIQFAIWYHDIIYKPGSPFNEKKSAALAKKRLHTLKIPLSVIEQVHYMICCSKRHDNPQNDLDTQYFLDADIGILGADRHIYQQYVEYIQKEFSAVPRCLYRRGRRKLLISLLARSALFKTDFFYSRYEESARSNLEWELEKQQ